MKRNVLFFVFDGFAEWEAAYATTGIVKSEHYHVKTLAIDKTLKRSMGGTRVLPDLDFFPETDLKDIDKSTTAMLILPGGTAWEEGENLAVADLVLHCIQQHIPVAAICGATFFLADLGLLDNIEHTSNDLHYLQQVSPSYRGRDNYVNQLSVRSESIITANGTAPVEFARDIFTVLGISNNEKTVQWFQYFEKMTA
jgi:putative intracellular protease/amidase